jgi:hypothetical protein
VPERAGVPPAEQAGGDAATPAGPRSAPANAWSRLAAAGTLRPFRVSYAGLILVPAAAWGVLAYNDVVVDARHIALPENLGVFYALSLTLAAATLAFDLFCPELIKRHRRYDQYVVHLGWYVREVGYVEHRHREAIQAHARELVSDLDGVPAGRSRELADEITQAASDRVRAPLSAELDEIIARAPRDWAEADACRKSIRNTIVVLYGLAAATAGYLFFLVPVWRVVCALSGS